MAFDISYEYDDAGNRITKTEVSDAGTIVTSSTYSAANRLISSNRAGRVTTYEHDAATFNTEGTKSTKDHEEGGRWEGDFGGGGRVRGGRMGGVAEER